MVKMFKLDGKIVLSSRQKFDQSFFCFLFVDLNFSEFTKMVGFQPHAKRGNEANAVRNGKICFVLGTCPVP